MKIAFTSCASTNLVPSQPIWNDIRASQPDHVVLLGDNFYNDVPDVSMIALQEMADWPFAEHLFVRYQQQLNEPRFRQLVATPGIQFHAIWDDHDFAWNNAAGGRMLDDPKQAGKVKISTSFMRAFRKALAAHDLGAFPSSPGAPELWADYMAPTFNPLGAQSIALESNGRSWLHLTDGRTLRKRPEILGTAQRTQLAQAFGAQPGALHIIASGVTFSQGDGWHKYPTDRNWLAQAAGDQAWLMLSGDIHSNGLLEHKLSAKGRLVEATASGAAIHAYLNGLIKGPEVRNHGMLDLQPDQLLIRLLAFNKPMTEARYERTAAGGLVVA
jgi:phosphodiesterase/alkaline phosphatase D-like protein